MTIECTDKQIDYAKLLLKVICEERAPTYAITVGGFVIEPALFYIWNQLINKKEEEK